MVAPVLYNFDLDDQCYRVRLTASILSVELEIKNINAFPGGEHQKPAFLLTNPLGRLPALTDGAQTLCQVAAIQLYLSDLSDHDHFVPSEPSAFCAMMDWLIFADRDLSCASQARAVSVMDFPHKVADDLAHLVSHTRDMFRIMEDHLSAQKLLGHGYFVKNELTLADIALFPAFALSRDIGIDHDEYPALRSWIRKVRAVNGFVTMPGIPDYH